jgi:hypothetical protein
MTNFYGYKRLAKPEQWKEVVGQENWGVGRSAYEVAFSWQTAGGLPPGIAKALAASGARPLAGVHLDVAIVEKPIFLDAQTTPSITDLIGYGRNAADEPIVVAVEGKAQETFGLPVRSWLRGDALEFRTSVEPTPTRTRRFEFLCERLGLGVDHECQLRYQLLHRTVSALLEGELHAAAAVVIVVHAFGPQSAGNWTDYQLFLEALGAPTPAPGVVAGPLRLGSGRKTDTFFLWWQDAHGGVV